MKSKSFKVLALVTEDFLCKNFKFYGFSLQTEKNTLRNVKVGIVIN